MGGPLAQVNLTLQLRSVWRILPEFGLADPRVDGLTDWSPEFVKDIHFKCANLLKPVSLGDDLNKPNSDGVRRWWGFDSRKS